MLPKVSKNLFKLEHVKSAGHLKGTGREYTHAITQNHAKQFK